MNKILTNTRFVIEQSAFVKINTSAIDQLVEQFEIKDVKHWLNDLPFQLSAEDMLTFLFLNIGINFSFWGNPLWTIHYQEKEYSRTFGLLFAFKRALEEGIPIFDWNFLRDISLKEFAFMLRGNTDIPLLQERFNIVHELATGIVTKYQGKVSKLLVASDYDVVKLLECVIKDFPSFHDVSVYKGKTISFHKRAQVFIGDVDYLLKLQNGKGLQNSDELTALPDYRLPQILRHLNILVYDDQLEKIVDNEIEIPHHSEMEVEIRAATIWAIEEMKLRLKKKYPDITTALLSSYFWLMSKSISGIINPHHLTRSIAY